MSRIRCIVVGFCVTLAFLGVAGAGSEQATKLRSMNGLSPYSPAAGFLAANFVADEADPAFVFGKVGEFAKSRGCPTAWLMEEGERQRVEKKDQAAGSIEYTLYLEEDCPGKVMYYVFVDRSQADSARWLEWRKQFHKSKADPHYGAAKTALEQASRNGVTVGAELRFVAENGDLVLKRTEDLLTKEIKLQPIYDLRQGKTLTP